MITGMSRDQSNMFHEPNLEKVLTDFVSNCRRVQKTLKACPTKGINEPGTVH